MIAHRHSKNDRDGEEATATPEIAYQSATVQKLGSAISISQKGNRSSKRSATMGDEEDKSQHREKERDHSHHRHRHHHRRHGDDRDDEDRHHRKKRRREDDEDRDTSHRHKSHHRSHHKSRDRDETEDNNAVDPIDGDTQQDETQESKVERESWMTGESDEKVDPFASFLGGQRKEKKPVEKPKPEGLGLSSREINSNLLNPPEPEPEPGAEEEEKYTPPTYTIGDDGSSWRMMKLKNLRIAAKEAMRPVEEIAVERWGSMRAYDEAREEEKELERRKLDRKGQGVLKLKVTGELYLQRLAKQQRKAHREEERNRPQPQPPPAATTTTGEPLITQSDLNKLQAQLLRAEMSNSPAAATLAQEYASAVEKFNTQPTAPQVIALPTSHTALLPHLSREQSKSSADLTIEDMVKEERASKRAHTVDRIARDKRFKDDLEYMDENAERLAEMGKRKEVDLKSMSVAEYKKQERIVANCPLCYKDDGRMPLAPVVSLGTRVYLSLPTEPELTKDGAMIVPLRHAKNLAECDDDEWEEIRVQHPNTYLC